MGAIDTQQAYGPAETPARRRDYTAVYLLALFLLTLPLANPMIHADGVGYYAYLRSLLIDHDLDFENEWLAGNQTFVWRVTGGARHLLPNQYAPTGRVANKYPVGAALLWFPFVGAAHVVVLTLDSFGAAVPADGYSEPYLLAMALATAFYGFLALWLSFDVAARLLSRPVAFVAVVGIWFGTGLPVYMYLLPSLSHAHSAFAIALFLWYWQRNRDRLDVRTCVVLGLVYGLAVEVYNPNAVAGVILLPATLLRAWRALRTHCLQLGRTLSWVSAFAAGAAVAYLPNLVTRLIIFGGPFVSGYSERWFWSAPALLSVLFSAKHGLLSWTPILGGSLLGLIVLAGSKRQFALELGGCFLAFWYLIACYEVWSGASSFGNRFFLSLTPVFVIGLGAALDAAWRPKAGRIVATALVGFLIAWNFGLMFQWSTNMIDRWAAVSWSVVARNQRVVGASAFRYAKQYLFGRRVLMDELERKYLESLKKPTRK